MVIRQAYLDKIKPFIGTDLIKIITGIRRDESFHGKKYKSTPYHLVDLIQEVKEDGTLIINNRREEEAV